MILDKLPPALGFAIVAAIPLVLLFIFFKPRPYQPPKDTSPSPMREALNGAPEDDYREPPEPYPWQIPGKPQLEFNRDETFGQWVGRALRNSFVLDLYLLVPLLGLAAVILVLVLLAVLM